MPDDIAAQEVLTLARTSARWPRSGWRADIIRELTVPICLSAVGIQPRVWAHLTNRHVCVGRRSIEVPVLSPNKVWAARSIRIPRALWDLMVEASPWILDEDESIHVVSPFIADGYMRRVAGFRRNVLRNLRLVAEAAGIECAVTWQRLCAAHERAMRGSPGVTPEEVDLRMGRKPKTRRERYRHSPKR